MTKRLFALLNGIWLLSLLALTASAREVPDLTRQDCSIEVVVEYGGKPVSGGTLTAIRVGQIAEEDGNYFFCRIPDGAPLENIQSPRTVEEMEAFAKAQAGLDTHTASVQNGKAGFYGLPTGLYLMVQKSPAEGYSPLKAFLVSLPYNENGQYLYHVTAHAKTELERTPKPTTPPSPTPSGELPQTGTLNWPVPVLAGMGLMLMMLGWWMKKTNQT